MKYWILFISLLLNMTAYAAGFPAFYGAQQQAHLHNANISYYRFGQGKPLVLVNGHGDYMAMWHPDFLRALSKTHEVIIFDYPGIGKSSMQSAYPNSMSQLANVVNEFISSQQLTQPDILGFSMGGSLVLYMASVNSTNYNHVITVGAKAGGKKTITPAPKYFNMLSDPAISPAVAIKTLLFPPTATAQADAYLKILAQLPQEKMDAAALKAQAAAVNGENAGDGIWNQLTNIKNLILIINGTDDVLTPVGNAPMIAAAIPGAWLVQIKGAGHGVLFQEPNYMADVVNLFLR